MVHDKKKKKERDCFAAYPESQNQSTVNIPISNIFSVIPIALDSTFTSKAIAFVSRLCFYFVGPLLSMCVCKLSCNFITGDKEAMLVHCCCLCLIWMTDLQWPVTKKIGKTWCDWSLVRMHIYLMVCRQKSKGCALCSDSQLRYYGNEIWIMVLGRLVIFKYTVEFEICVYQNSAKQSLLVIEAHDTQVTTNLNGDTEWVGFR